jgi:5-formyltetrahydrofolate cyclo-ligase
VGKKRSELRAEMRRVISNLDRRWLAAASHDLCRELTTLLDTELPGAIDHVLVWTAFFPGEVDLSRFIEGQFGRRRVYMPRTLPDRTMQFMAVERGWLLHAEKSTFGIPEPRFEEGKAFDLKEAPRTAVIVPGLAFDRAGDRLGRGGGYYDRFLGRVAMQRAIKIGVCWELQVVDRVPTESHDVAVDWLCHEQGFIRVGSPADRGV